MLQTILNAIIPVAVTALVAVGVAVIKAFGDAGVEFIQQKQKALQVKIGADTYNKNLALAKSVYAGVDETFRITPTLEKSIAAKQAAFAVEIKKLIPAITDDEIAQLRQAIAGEVNKGRDAILAPEVSEPEAPAADTPTTDAAVQTITVSLNGVPVTVPATTAQ